MTYDQVWPAWIGPSYCLTAYSGKWGQGTCPGVAAACVNPGILPGLTVGGGPVDHTLADMSVSQNS